MTRQHLPPPPTARLEFRSWKPDDLEAFHAICSDPAVMKFIGSGQPWPRETTRKFIERADRLLRERGFCQWPLIHRRDSTLIGFCGFVDSGEGPEIGWRLASTYWGQGLATEAARAVLRHGLETLGFERVVATVQAGNEASDRIARKLGMRPITSMERHGRKVILYEIIVR